ncbi:MAG: DUF5678 domain-containing protein, partial [Armatimonadota bacterium]|nr:DUF5678 domain-containing protein [Armatimonadota bacterium]
RDELLKTHFGKWVAIVEGKVAAVGDQMSKVAAEAFQKTGKAVMYVACVGKEDTVLKVRKVSFGFYDPNFVPPMPILSASVSDPYRRQQIQTDAIVDTGADLSLLKEAVGNQIGLGSYPSGQMLISGIGAQPQTRQLYSTILSLAGKEIFTLVDLRDDIDENILGRDVLNWFRLTLSAQENLV